MLCGSQLHIQVDSQDGHMQNMSEIKHLSRDMRFPTISIDSDQPAHMRSLIRTFDSRLNIL